VLQLGVAVPAIFQRTTGTVKFIMVDEAFAPIDLTDGNGTLKIKMKTKKVSMI
jgi:hypothetical protein